MPSQGAHNNASDAGAEAIASPKILANLLELDLRHNPRLTAVGKAMLRMRFGDRVKLD